MQQTAGYLWWSWTYEKSVARGQKVILQKDSGGEHVMERLNTDDNPAIATVKMGVTLNMDNFESLRVDVGLSLPCDPENVEDAYEQVYDAVKDKLVEKAQRFKRLWMTGK